MPVASEDVDEAVLRMLQRDQVVMMEDLIIGQPDFSWSQLFLAIDRLSRKNLIALHRMGLTYQIQPTTQTWHLGRMPHREEASANLP